MRITRIHADRYSSSELEKLDIALELFSHAVNSVNFQRTIEQHILFETNSNFSNREIYNIIMGGDEAFTNEGVDFEADLDLTLDFRISTDAIGFTIKERIFTFRNFFQQLRPTKLAGHYAHEYCHTLGFSDPRDLTDIARNVPYEIGRIIEEIAINNHRVFITSNLNLTEDRDTRSLDNFRNASVVDSESVVNTTLINSDHLLPSKAKLKKGKAVKKAKDRKISSKKASRLPKSIKKKAIEKIIKVATKKAKPVRKKRSKPKQATLIPKHRAQK